MMAHNCHAACCTVPVPPEMLMCRKHWYMVPPVLRRQVWRAYRRGQCDDKRPSAAWCLVADMAVAHVAALEGRQKVGLTFMAAFFPTSKATVRIIKCHCPPGAYPCECDPPR